MHFPLPFAIAASVVSLTLAGCGGSGTGGVGAAPVSLGTPIVLDASIRDLSQTTQLIVSSVASIAGTFTTNGATSMTVATSPTNFSVTTAAGSITSMVVNIPGLGISQAFSGTDISRQGIFPASTVTTSDVQRGLGQALLLASVLNPGTASLQYHTLGAWGYLPSTSGTAFTETWFTAGTQTAGSAIPTTGTATYTGVAAGSVYSATTAHDFDAVANATANFGTRSVSFSTTQSFKQDQNVASPARVSAPELNMTGTLSYQPGTNALTGTVATTGNAMSGSASANFFGPQAAELGGTLMLQDNAQTTRALGGFALHR